MVALFFRPRSIAVAVAIIITAKPTSNTVPGITWPGPAGVGARLAVAPNRSAVRRCTGGHRVGNRADRAGSSGDQ